MDRIITLNMAKVGERFIVLGFVGRTAITDRLNDLGLTEGATGCVVAVAPFGGAACVAFRGYKLSIKLRDLKNVSVRVIN